MRCAFSRHPLHKRLLFLFAAAAAWVQVSEVLAQEVIARAGEHGEFTRVTLAFQELSSWVVEPNNDDPSILEIIVSPRFSSMDTTQLFSRIDHSRIDSIRAIPEENRIVVNFACRCNAKVFLARGNLLGVDVRDGSRTPEKAAKRVADLHLPFLPTNSGSILPMPLAKPGNNDRFAELAGMPKIDSAFGAQVKEFEDVLARSMPSGIVSHPRGASSPDIDFNIGSVPLDADYRTAELPTLRSTTESPAEGEPNYLRPATGHSVGECISDSQIEAIVPAAQPSPLTSMSLAMVNLAAPRDRFDRKAASDLARAFMAVGLSREAVHVINTFTDADALFLELAQVISGEVRDVSLIQGQSVCPGRVAFWAFLANGGTGNEAESVADGIIRAEIERLTPALRDRISERLVNSLEKARKVSLLADLRLAFPEFAEHAELSDAIADPPDPRDMLADAIMRSEGRFEEKSAEQGSADPDLAAALEKEFRGTEAHFDSWKASVLATADAGRFQEAFDEYRLGSGSGKSPRRVLRSLVSTLAEKASIPVFLTTALSLTDDEKDALGVEEILMLADRLNQNGFFGAALEFLQHEENASDDPRIKIALGTAYLGLGDPVKAELAVIGLAQKEAVQLRAKSRLMMGDYSFAQTAYGTMPEDEEVLAAWMSDDWEHLADKGGSAQARYAELARSRKPESASAGEMTLSRANSILDESRNLRDLMSALLQQDGGQNP